MRMRIGNVVDESNPDSGTDRPRWPYWVIGLALAGLVIAILVAAFILDARLRPPVGIEATRTAADGIQVTAVPDARISESLSSPAASSPISAPAVATAMDSKDAVESAYLRYWDIYSQALYSLDPSHLGEVMAGNELNDAEKQIDELRSQNHAAKTDVQHHYVIVNVTAGQASIEDRYLNKSYLVDATSKNPLQNPGQGETVDIACQLQVIDGTWKVVSVVQVQR